MAQDFWALTTYFNPKGWKSRRLNYDIFRKNLALPLMTVEWSPLGRFELGPSDADQLIQVSGGDLMWQKERLLNIGLNQLPHDCEYVAWIDSDIIFETPGWVDMARKKLHKKAVVQLFSESRHLKPGVIKSGSPSTYLRQDQGIAAASQGANCPKTFIDELLQERERSLQGHTLPASSPKTSPGFAWAATRSWLEAIGGLYDASIIGGGDTVFFMALSGRLNDFADIYRNQHAFTDNNRLRLWNEKTRTAGTRVEFIKGIISHLFHGSLENRQYVERHKLLTRSGLDIDAHLLDEQGKPWKFTTRTPLQVREAIEMYFESRHEDEGIPHNS